MTSPVAVVGSDDVVEKVLRLQTEFSSLRLLAMPYLTEAEVPPLVHQAKKVAEVIVFAGPVPYFIAQSLEKITIPMLYVSFTGTGLMQILFHVFHQKNIAVDSLSIDILPEKVVRETLDDLGLKDINIYTMEYTGDERSDQLVDFHWRLWQEGKTSIALSCLRSAYWGLIEKDVPAFRIQPASSAIREALKHAVIQVENVRSEEIQIAVQICDIDGFNSLTRKLNSEYQAQRIKLNLQQILNDYAERTRASVHAEGGDRYIIFTTRGILEKYSNFYQSDPLLEEVRRQLTATVSIGTGLGRTAYDAEKNALIALKQAKEAGGDCSYALMANGKMLGPLGRFTRLESFITSNDDTIVEMADEANVSVDTLTKIISLLDLLGKETLTSSELAEELRVSTRSATRILHRLASANLATPYGTVKLRSTGRPRQIFLLKLKPKDKLS